MVDEKLSTTQEVDLDSEVESTLQDLALFIYELYKETRSVV
jgi:hypothetical protein